jgi:RhtB (resistance to homoserine/threonine) family protein
MEFFLKWLIFVSVNAAAVITPGPAFAMTVRSATAYGRRASLLTALGLGLGVGGLVCLVMGGMGILLASSIFLFNVLKYCGAAYLFYVGVRAIRARKIASPNSEAATNPTHTYREISGRRAFLYGFLTNISNPKGYVFFTAIISQFVSPDMPLWNMAVYVITAMILETGWFSFVALILTDTRVRARFMKISHWIERVCGGLMIALGIKLAVSRI